MPDDEVWIHESMAKSLFEQGYIRMPTVSEVAHFSLELYATEYMAGGELLTKKLSGIIPRTYYERLLQELELYKKANETFAASLKDHSQTIDNRGNRLEQKEERFHIHAFPDQKQEIPTDVKDREEALKGQLLSIPGLRIGKTAADYRASSENGET